MAEITYTHIIGSLGVLVLGSMVLLAVTRLWLQLGRYEAAQAQHTQFLQQRIVQLEQMINAQAVMQLDAAKLGQSRTVENDQPEYPVGSPLPTRAYPPPYAGDEDEEEGPPPQTRPPLGE